MSTTLIFCVSFLCGIFIPFVPKFVLWIIPPKTTIVFRYPGKIEVVVFHGSPKDAESFLLRIDEYTKVLPETHAKIRDQVLPYQKIKM